MTYRRTFGRPIYCPNEEVIWAFWNKNIDPKLKIMKFYTMDELLGSSPITNPDLPIRNTYVQLKDGIWTASPESIQRDFSENNLFIMSPFTGPETVFQAVNILINDSNFKKFFGHGSSHTNSVDPTNIYDRLRLFAEYNDKYRRNFM